MNPIAPVPELQRALEEFLVRLFNAGESEGLENLVDMDMSLSQARTIFMLFHCGGAVPINEIADQLNLSVAAAGRNVDQLVKLNLVERRESTDDRRVKLVSLSAAGAKVARQHFDVKINEIKNFAERLTPEHRRALSEALAPILAGDYLQPTKRKNCL